MILFVYRAAYKMLLEKKNIIHHMNVVTKPPRTLSLHMNSYMNIFNVLDQYPIYTQMTFLYQTY